MASATLFGDWTQYGGTHGNWNAAPTYGAPGLLNVNLIPMRVL